MAEVILLSSHHPLTLLQAFNFFLFFFIYYTHFEIIVGPRNLIGSKWCNLFTNPTIFALNHIFFPGNEATLKTKQPIRFQGLFKETNQIAGK